MMIPVEGHSNLYRDEKSGAIVNCDNQSYNQYLIGVEKRKKQQLEIECLKNDIKEIKFLLEEILHGPKQN